MATLWLGGSSNLARTYANQFGCEDLVITGVEDIPPAWATCRYVRLDLTQTTDDEARKVLEGVRTIVIGVRPKLFASNIHDKKPLQMIEGIRTILRHAVSNTKVIHISSIAAIDHLRETIMVNETDPIPDLSEIRQPYDVFKRRCERAIDDASPSGATHLRLGAIFTDDPTCIQCKALDMQFRIGCYLPLKIDCNSAANVARVIHAMIQTKKRLQNVYYYTRPLHMTEPVPYGYYLESYRSAYQTFCIWIPAWTVTWVVSLVHILAVWCGSHIPYLDAADYLLQVSTMEHTFDCSRLKREFPDLVEETILECFVRRRVTLDSESKS